MQKQITFTGWSAVMVRGSQSGSAHYRVRLGPRQARLLLGLKAALTQRLRPELEIEALVSSKDELTTLALALETGDCWRPCVNRACVVIVDAHAFRWRWFSGGPETVDQDETEDFGFEDLRRKMKRAGWLD